MFKSTLSNGLFLAGALAAVGLIWLGLSSPQSKGSGNNTAYAATIYKSPTCGCCGEYADYLEEKGVDVTVHHTDDRDDLHTSHGIPEDMASCHTTMMGDYFFEGHIPFEVMSEMMESHTQVDGLALPGMPSGSPGMPGQKVAPFHIFQMINGQASDYGEF